MITLLHYPLTHLLATRLVVVNLALFVTIHHAYFKWYNLYFLWTPDVHWSHVTTMQSYSTFIHMTSLVVQDPCCDVLLILSIAVTSITLTLLIIYFSPLTLLLPRLILHLTQLFIILVVQVRYLLLLTFLPVCSFSLFVLWVVILDHPLWCYTNHDLYQMADFNLDSMFFHHCY